MIKYKNTGGGSGIDAYEIGNDFIKVQFDDGSIYLYNIFITGTSNIEQMKKLAVNGKGLNSFIDNNVKNKFHSKLK